jgi:hypothetical protein
MPGGFDKNAGYNTFGLGPMGISTGNPTADMFANMVFGNQLAPRPAMGSAQSVYDAFFQRDRNLQFIQLRNQALANSFFAQKMGGINPNSTALNVFGAFLGGPSSGFMNAVSPFMGGNPVKAQMGLYANLTGQTMGAFGDMGSITVPQTTELMNSWYQHAWTKRTVDQAYISQERQSAEARANRIMARNNGGFMSGAFSRALSSGNASGFEMQFGTDINSSLGGELDSAMSRIGRAKSSTDISDIKLKASEAADRFLDRITDPSVRDKMAKAFGDALDKGASGVAGFKSTYTAAGGQLSAILRGQAGLKVGDERIMGFNFANTRGFQVDDVMGAFTSAADYRLMGRRGLNASFGGFANNGIGVLDAARSIFGHGKSGKELMGGLDELLGSSFVDLTDAGSSQKLENLLYRVKGAAKTAGVSIETILGIISEGNKLASMTPGLQMMGGLGMMNASIRVMNNTTAASAYMGNDYMRMYGGPVGYAQRAMQGELQSANEPITNRLGSLYAYLSLNGNTAGLNALTGQINGGAPDRFTRPGFNAMIKHIANASGISAMTLQDAAQNNPMLAAQGKSMAAAAGIDIYGVGGQAMVQELRRSVALQFAGSSQGGKLGLAALDYAMSGGGDFAKNRFNSSIDRSKLSASELTMVTNMESKFAQGKRFAPHELAAVLGLRGAGMSRMLEAVHNYGYDPLLLASSSPTFKALQGQAGAYTSEYARISSDMSKTYGYLNAPFSQSIMNQIYGGELSNEGLSTLLDPLKGKTGYSEIKSYYQNVIDIGRAKDPSGVIAGIYGVSASSVKDLNMLSGKMSWEKIRNLKDYSGLSSTQLAKAQKALNQIDKEKRLTGHVSLNKFVQEEQFRGVSDIVGSVAEKEYSSIANQQYQDMVLGESTGAAGVGRDSFISGVDQVNKLLSKYGAVGKYGVMDAKKVSQLMMSDANFKVDYNKLSASGGGASAASEALEKIINQYRSSVESSRPHYEALKEKMDDEKKMNDVIKVLEDLTNNLGSGFGTNVVDAIATLSSTINSAIGAQ